MRTSFRLVKNNDHRDKVRPFKAKCVDINYENAFFFFTPQVSHLPSVNWRRYSYKWTFVLQECRACRSDGGWEGGAARLCGRLFSSQSKPLVAYSKQHKSTLPQWIKYSFWTFCDSITSCWKSQQKIIYMNNEVNTNCFNKTPMHAKRKTYSLKGIGPMPWNISEGL